MASSSAHPGPFHAPHTRNPFLPARKKPFILTKGFRNSILAILAVTTIGHEVSQLHPLDRIMRSSGDTTLPVKDILSSINQNTFSAGVEKNAQHYQEKNLNPEQIQMLAESRTRLDFLVEAFNHNKITAHQFLFTLFDKNSRTVATPGTFLTVKTLVNGLEQNSSKQHPSIPNEFLYIMKSDLDNQNNPHSNIYNLTVHRINRGWRLSFNLNGDRYDVDCGFKLTRN